MAHKSCVVKMSVDYTAVPIPLAAELPGLSSSSLAATNLASAARRRFSVISKSRSDNRVGSEIKEVEGSTVDNSCDKDDRKCCVESVNCEILGGRPVKTTQESEGFTSTHLSNALEHTCTPAVLTYHSNPQDFEQVTNDNLRPKKLEPRRDVTNCAMTQKSTDGVREDWVPGRKMTQDKMEELNSYSIKVGKNIFFLNFKCIVDGRIFVR